MPLASDFIDREIFHYLQMIYVKKGIREKNSRRF